MISTWFRVTVRCYLYLWNDYYIFFFHSFVVWQAWNNIQVGVAIIFSFSIIWNFGLYFRSNYVIILISFLKHVGDLHANNQCCINRIDQWTSISSWNSCVSDKRGYFRTEATNIRKPFAFVPSDIISHFESYNILWFFFFFFCCIALYQCDDSPYRVAIKIIYVSWNETRRINTERACNETVFSIDTCV